MAVAVLTPKQQAFRKALLARIHCASVYREVYADNRAAWQALLHKHFGKRSSADLRIDQLVLLLDFLSGRRRAPAASSSQRQLGYLRALWQQRARNPDDKNLLAFARKNTGLLLLGLHVLNRQQISGLIAALKRM